MFAPSDLFDLTQTAHASLFEGCECAWEALRRLRDYVSARAVAELRHRAEGRAWIGPQVSIGEGTVVEDGVMIKGPAIIGRNCQIRHGAYIRDHVLIGDDCVVGNACELKNAVLFNGADVPHFNYVGDSILGFESHLGAGVIISNLKITPGNVTVERDGQPFDTGLRKFGAMIGDHANVGCNAVLNPGAILGRSSLVYPCVNWRGVLPANMIAKSPTEVVVRRPRSA
jgi:NDP-sugar pyrophosphorylase family protein